ncbi:MAG: response regulator transcription factor [Myxococcales bacterium]|nr:response regulator transcription factor [Myxococcales bacterium]
MKRPISYVIVIGHEQELERDEGAANVLRGLGATVRTMGLWDDPNAVLPGDDERVRAIVIEALDRPDLANGALRALRREARLAGSGAIVAVSVAQVAQLDPAAGFDDFVLVPFVPAELYARVRALEWRRSEFANEERFKLGEIVIDRSAREVCVGATMVSLTLREFALLSYLCEHRGRVVSRDEALARVWGPSYEGGARTVDIHVRRLRSKLGAALPLVTLRGAGYKLTAPGTDGARPGARA